MQTLMHFHSINPVQREDGRTLRRRRAQPTQQLPTIESCRMLPRLPYTQSGIPALMLVAASVSQFVARMRQIPVEVFVSPLVAQEYFKEAGEAVYYTAVYAQCGMEACRVIAWPGLANDTAVCYGRI